MTRLRGVAPRCNFIQKCECNRDVSYADSVIRFKLIAGLYDTEIKEDILSAEDKSLDETVKAIEAKESGKLARKTVGVVHDSAPRVRIIEQGQQTCGHCNRTGHSSSQADREKFCPAYNKNCGNCDKKGHFRVVCKSKSRQLKKKSVREVSEGSSSADLDCTFANPYLQLQNNQSAEINSISFGELAALRYSMGKISREMQLINKVKVPHMLFDQLKWVTSHPPAAPFIRLKVEVDTKAYRFNSIKPPSAYKHRTAVMDALADSGCQACCMGLEQLPRLGLSTNDLLECDMKLSGANNSTIEVVGAVFIVISGKDKSGNSWQTNQLCYVARGVKKLIMSMEACMKLGILSQSFPDVGCRNEVDVGTTSN